MGRPKVKIIDDSQTEEVKKQPQPKPAKKETSAIGRSSSGRDSLVAKLQAELGIEEKPQPEAKEITSESKTDQNIEDAKTEPAEPQAEKKSAVKVKKPGKAKPRSKKYQAIIETANKDLKNEDQDDFDYKSQSYKIPQAVSLVKKLSYSKFDGTLEAHINTAQKNIRGFLQLPFAAGKKVRVLAFGKDADKSGADQIGTDEKIEEISKGKIDFDIIVTTPEWMPKLAKVAKNLGPRGLMPNPKNGTISEDLKKAVESFQSGKSEFKTEAKAAVIHLSLGKLNQPDEELEANIKAALTTIGKSKLKKVTLAPTMGPSVKLDFSAI